MINMVTGALEEEEVNVCDLGSHATFEVTPYKDANKMSRLD